MSKRKIIGLIVVIGVTMAFLIFEVVTIVNTLKTNKNASLQNVGSKNTTKLEATATPIPSTIMNAPVESNLENYIPFLKKPLSGFYDIISEIPNIKSYSNPLCKNGQNQCFYFENTTGNWYEVGSNRKIPATRPFAIRLSLNSTNTLASIVLHGNPPLKGDAWWKGSPSLLIGYNGNGTRLYIDARNGTKPESFPLTSKQLVDSNSQNKPGTIYIIVDPVSSKILVLDQQFETVVFIDVNLVTKNAFPSGLFPEKYFTPSVGLADGSKMLLTDFTILPL